MIGLKATIATLTVLAALAEEDFKDESVRFSMVMMDRKDVEALKGAAGVLENVRHMRKLMGREDEE